MIGCNKVKIVCLGSPDSKEKIMYQLSRANKPQNRLSTLLSLILQELM